MFENIAAFDIGTSSIKVVTVKTGIKNFRIKNFIYEDINAGDGSPDAITTVIKRIITENELKEYKILLNLPMQKTIIRNLSFPFRDKEKIAEAIPFETEDIIPYNLEDIVLDFQLINTKDYESGNVLLAAAPKEAVQKQISYFKELGITPVSMGLEAQAIFECYRYFNKIKDEGIIQIDIGNEKTILNIVHDNDLLFTRSIAIGANSIFYAISGAFKMQTEEAVKIFEDFKMDLSSFENNLQKDYQKELNIKKNTLKGIYNISLEKVYELIEQIELSKMAFFNEYPDISFSRILISGGGSNITGIGAIISREMDLPVIALPFLDEYTESKITSQFPGALGMILSYINSKYSAISFLKNEFLPETSGLSLKQYYLSGVFIILALMVLLVNLIATSYLKSESNEKYTEILNERFKKYFHVAIISGDPVSEAEKLLKEEQKEFENIDSLVHSNEKILDTLKDILSFFPKDDTFELRNIVINESIIRLDGSIGSSTNIDEFKNKLKESKKYDDVTYKTSYRKGNEISFNMTIRLKVQGNVKKEVK